MNYLNLRDRVQSELSRPDLSTNISNWIYDTRREIVDGTLPGAQGFYRFSWSYNISNMVSPSSTMEVSLPANFIDEISFFNIPDEKPVVKVDSPAYWDSLFYSSDQALSDTGDPTNYLILGETFLFYPVGETSVGMRYYAYPADLSTDTSEYAIDRKVPSLIIYGAALKGAVFLHDNDLIAIYSSMVQSHYSSAIASDKRKKFANRMIRIKTYQDYRMEHWKSMKFMPD